MEKKNILLLALIAILEGLQVVILVAVVSQIFPIKYDLMEMFIPLESQHYFRPEREVLFYRLFVLSAVAIQMAGLRIFQKRLGEKDFSPALGRFLAADGILVGLMAFAFFKMAVYDPAPLAGILFYAVFALSWVVRGFWLWRPRFLRKVSESLLSPRTQRTLARVVDAGVPFLVFLSIYIPDRAGAMAVIYQNDRFFHFDGYIMAPAWAFMKGCLLNIDTFSAYSIGMPVFLATLCRAFGQVNYENMLLVFLILTAVYFVLVYVLLRMWLKSAWLALAGVLFALKFQMFYGVDPFELFVWKYPSTTVLRYFFDVAVFIFLWGHLRSGRKRYLWTALGLIGAALFYMNDTGLYLLVTTYAYIGIILFSPAYRKMLYAVKRDLVMIAGYVALPLVVVFALYAFFLKKHLWDPSSWADTLILVNLFKHGHGALPIYLGLEQKQFVAFFFGIAVGLFYVITVVSQVLLLLLNKTKKENILGLVIGLYGLCLYHYFVVRSAAFNYHVVMVPAVLLFCFWVSEGLKNFDMGQRRKNLGVLLALAFFSLGTTHGFLRYPNLFHRNDPTIAAAKKFMQEDFAVDADTKMITELTPSDRPAALVSSFEVAILMKANRRPFFYNFPLIYPRYMRMKDFGGVKLFYKGSLDKVLEQLEKEKPEYLFFEKKLIKGEIPGVYYQRHPFLAALVGYTWKNYTPVRTGEYIVAFKRKGL